MENSREIVVTSAKCTESRDNGDTYTKLIILRALQELRQLYVVIDYYNFQTERKG